MSCFQKALAKTVYHSISISESEICCWVIACVSHCSISHTRVLAVYKQIGLIVGTLPNTKTDPCKEHIIFPFLHGQTSTAKSVSLKHPLGPWRLVVFLSPRRLRPSIAWAPHPPPCRPRCPAERSPAVAWQCRWDGRWCQQPAGA